MKSKQFKVTVIIPVFNVAEYVPMAIESVLALVEVEELILVEDGSTDKSLEVCKSYADVHERVRLLRHANGANKGISASRNLGIKEAKTEYISFLDADDWYLSNRFNAEENLLQQGVDFDGVYGGTGFYYQAEGSIDKMKLTTFPKKVKPEDLIMSFLDTTEDRFTTDAITFKKSFLDRIGYFNESMALAEDTHLWIRAAGLGKIYHGLNTQAIAIRRVHDRNTSRHSNKESIRTLYSNLYKSLRKEKEVRKDAMNIIFRRFVGTQTFSPWKRALIASYELGKRPYMIDKVLFS